MKRRLTALIIAGTIIVAASITSLVIWLNKPSYDDVVKNCHKALVSQSKAREKGKPGACKDVKDDDYTALVMNNAINDLGWTDEDGNLNENKMLEDTINGVP